MVSYQNTFNTKLFVMIFVLCQWTIADLFNAMSDIESLLATHEAVISSLEVYVNAEEKKLSILSRHLTSFIKHEKAIEDAPRDNYLDNPMNSFMILNRLSIKLRLIERLVTTDTEFTKNKTLRFPSEEDLEGAIEALARLQDTYRLNITEFAGGALGDTRQETSSQLSAHDCYLIGCLRYEKKDFEQGLVWMLEALSKHLAENHSISTEHENRSLSFVLGIGSHIADGYQMQNKLDSAREWTQWLTKVSSKQRQPRDLNSLIAIYRERIADEAAEKKENAPKLIFTPKTGNQMMKTSTFEYKNAYESLCRGDVQLPAKVTKRLKCRYLSEGHPFLRLARVKTEQLYYRPDIVMFHDVMNVAEIDYIKHLAKPKLQIAKIGRQNGTSATSKNIRTCKTVFLPEGDCEVLERVSRRVSHLTGLSVATAENLQVAHYGIGGHYSTHYDFSTNSSLFKYGQRKATVLFYMSEVTEGGATVFTELGLAVPPVKGAALYWHNVHRSGEKAFSTFHGGCPVLRGYKWVSTKWLHEEGQELLQPCDLVRDEDSYLRLTHQYP